MQCLHETKDRRSCVSELFFIEELVPKPFPSVTWLSRRLNAGTIPGSKVGRRWVMTRADVQQALELLKNKTAKPAGLTTATTRRRAS